jgi:hypothetical protein
MPAGRRLAWGLVAMSAAAGGAILAGSARSAPARGEPSATDPRVARGAGVARDRKASWRAPEDVRGPPEDQGRRQPPCE